MEENNLSTTAPEAEATQESTPVLTIEQNGETIVIKAPADVKVELVQEEKETVPVKKPWDTPLTIGLAAVLVLVIISVIIRKFIVSKKPAPQQAVEVLPAPAADAPTAPGTAGEVKLNNVEPKTAAMLMAIVADKMQKPINELRFISIKEVE